jgi:hypothetical protein
VIKYFKESCEKHSKLFIPDIPREDAVAESLGKYYNSKDLEKAIDWYVNTNKGPFLVFDFAVQSRDIIEKAKYESEAVDRFKQIVEETKRKFHTE